MRLLLVLRNARFLFVLLSLFALLTFLAAPLAAQDVWQSTIVPVGIGTDTTIKFGDRVPVAGSTSFRMLAMANDIVRTGFDGDSLHFDFGYRLGSDVNLPNGRVRTIFESLVVLDSIIITTAIDSIDTSATPDDTIYTFSVDGDTSSIFGYICSLPAIFTPTVRQFLQPYVKPRAGTRLGQTSGDVVFNVQRVTGSYTRK